MTSRRTHEKTSVTVYKQQNKNKNKKATEVQWNRINFQVEPSPLEIVATEYTVTNIKLRRQLTLYSVIYLVKKHNTNEKVKGRNIF